MNPDTPAGNTSVESDRANPPTSTAEHAPAAEHVPAEHVPAEHAPDVHAPVEPVESAEAQGGVPRRVGRIVLGVVLWAFLLLWVLLAAAVVFWMLVSLVALGGAPQLKAVVILAVIVAFVALGWWLAARFVASGRVVLRTVGLVVALVFLVGTVWALASPDATLFLARSMVWGDSDVDDWQKFPAGEVGNAGPVFEFAARPAPELSEKIEYTVDGETRESSLDELIEMTHTTSFIVIRDDTIVYEGYANGFDRDSVVTSFSVAKSFTSALVGIAIAEGDIGGVDDRMVEYIPEMRGRGLDEMTIRDLLLMSTGVRFVHQDDKSGLAQAWPFHDESMSYYWPDLRDLAESLPASDEPVGAAFSYNPYNTILLGVILERATHRPVTQYLQEKIWEPLGMEAPATWSLDSDETAFAKMESGLNARAIDFAKFGRLFLHDGNWDGRQIVPAEWVAESTAPDPSDDRPWLSGEDWFEAGGYYKYQWWGMPAGDGGYWYTASGHLGQHISVFPDDGVVIVRFGTSDEGIDDWDAVIATVADKTG